jgi:hypothetical protein
LCVIRIAAPFETYADILRDDKPGVYRLSS